MTIKKAYHIIRLILCRGGGQRARYIRKHSLFGAIGEHCYFHPYWMPSEPELIFIGDNVWVSANVTFITHDIANGMLGNQFPNKKFDPLFSKITIGNNVLIGANTVILPGIKIGDNVVIGAGSIVCRDIPDGIVAAGNPVSKIGDYSDFCRKRTKNSRDMVLNENSTRFTGKT